MSAFRSAGRGMLLAAAGGAVLVLLGIVADVDVLVLVGLALALTFSAIGITFLLVQAKVFGSPEERARILREGTPATATIGAVHNTASRVGGSPVLKLDLTLDGRLVTVRELVPLQHVHRLQVGEAIPVRINGSSVVVDWEG